jgi:hypothetical protein
MAKEANHVNELGMKTAESLIAAKGKVWLASKSSFGRREETLFYIPYKLAISCLADDLQRVGRVYAPIQAKTSPPGRSLNSW